MLKVDEQEKSLGKLRFGKDHKFKYILTNEFSKSLMINKLITGCSSCTKAYTNKTYLKPGESSDIIVTFTPGSKGQQVKTINVVYNNIENLLLKFTADVD